MVETFENAQFQIKMTHFRAHSYSFLVKITINDCYDTNFCRKITNFWFRNLKVFLIFFFWNFEIFGWWKIEIVMGGNSSHACKLEPDNSISIFGQTRLFLVKNEQSRKVRNHNVLLETKLDNDQKTFKWVLFY